ncbi:MAG: hypothetical protein KGH61_05640 [Candidatus Micrarchaeota archaeon]|nr:hypothetical protein [Candidatus Micrarchaeota archaeon]MDE1848396.1 hypothetical protein [Candidatus Micrarchaeota archaeon]
MANLKLMVLGLFCFIIGVLMFFNAGEFIPQTFECGGSILYGNTLVFAMFYETAVGLLLIGGLTILVSNFTTGKSVLSTFVAIVLVALIFAMLLGGVGAFGEGQLCGVACVAGPGFLCQAPVLATNGNMSFIFGQGTGSTYYNIGLGCAATAGSSGLPDPVWAIVYLSSSGNPTAATANAPGKGALSLQSGETSSIQGLKCFDQNGDPLAPIDGAANALPIGWGFLGGIWMNYTLSPGEANTSNPIYTQKVAGITLKVT